MKDKRQRQVEALERRENNARDYKGGNLGTLNTPADTNKAEYLGDKLKIAEKDIQQLRGKLGIK